MKYIFAFLFVVILVAPQGAQAQSVDRETLLAQIKALQALLAELQSQQEVRVPTKARPLTEFDSFIIKDESDVRERYLLPERGGVGTIRKAEHRLYLERFLTLVPDAYDRFFDEYVVFIEYESVDAFVETIPPYQIDTWRFGLSESAFEYRADAKENTELFVHEFAHVLSYDDIPKKANTEDDCHSYFNDYGCPPQNSYLLDFTDRFWTDQQLTRLGRSAETTIFSDREIARDFVSRYAATAPPEDFAESFAIFVLETEVKEGSGLKDEKVSYFYEFPELVTLREEIRSEI